MEKRVDWVVLMEELALMAVVGRLPWPGEQKSMFLEVPRLWDGFAVCTGAVRSASGRRERLAASDAFVGCM